MAKIFLVKRDYEADVKAIKVHDAADADILVFVEKLGPKGLGDTHWFYVSNIFYASTKLFWTSSTEPTDLKVFFVDDETQAGWANDHPLRGRL